MHLVGFIIRIYHDTQSSECQILLCLYLGAAFNKSCCHIAEVFARGRATTARNTGMEDVLVWNPPKLRIWSDS